MVGADLEKGTREKLDNWKLWVGIAYFGLALTVVALFFINQRTQTAAARHAAEITAGAQAQYVSCLAERPTLARVNLFVKGVRNVETTLVEDSVATLAITNPSTAAYKTRKQNLVRLESAASAASNVTFPVPTKAECLALKAKVLKQG